MTKDSQSEDRLQSDGHPENKEIEVYRDEADYIITTPPRVLFKTILFWAIEKQKKVSIMGKLDDVADEKIFEQIADDNLWLGLFPPKKGRTFVIPNECPIKDYQLRGKEKIVTRKDARFFTNIPNNRERYTIKTKTMKENLKENEMLIKTLKERYNTDTYPMYSDYFAYEAVTVTAIPKDSYRMYGVPLTFLDSYNPDEFKIEKADTPVIKPHIGDKILPKRILVRYFPFKSIF